MEFSASQGARCLQGLQLAPLRGQPLLRGLIQQTGLNLRALKIYFKWTSSFRRSESLFVSFQPATLGQKVSSHVVGRRLPATIASAYEVQSLPVPAHITAHSTRSAATSVAWSIQATLEDICRAATWSSPSSFIRHYKLDVYASAKASFGRRVLQQVLSGEASSDRATPSH